MTSDRLHASAILAPRRKTSFIISPAWCVIVILGIVAASFAYKMRTDSIFACGAGGYDGNSYLAYCQAAGFGDYDHGAFWFNLEPTANVAASAADVVFLGDSRMQFGFSTPETARWFSFAAARYFLLGFTYGGNVAFGEQLLQKLNPRAKFYVLTADFLERTETVPAKAVLKESTARARYAVKALRQRPHKAICERLHSICGNEYAIFRSRENGSFQITGAPDAGTPVVYDHDINREKIESYTRSGNAFLSQLPVTRECIILTIVPTIRAITFNYSSSYETAKGVADALGVTLVAPEPDGLRTFDGSHLEPQSAARWSAAFLQSAGPQIRKCLDAHT